MPNYNIFGLNRWLRCRRSFVAVPSSVFVTCMTFSTCQREEEIFMSSYPVGYPPFLGRVPGGLVQRGHQLTRQQLLQQQRL